MNTPCIYGRKSVKMLYPLIAEALTFKDLSFKYKVVV